MALGIAMLKVLPGKEHVVYHALRCREGILYVCTVFGEYDFMLIAQAEGLNELHCLINGIDEIGGVIATQMVLINRNDEMLALAC
ncbi:Lrp/AsnC ligand binding domain protein [uncultured archaeon]|nr:Lrp/AsnC ligand binding domain protein [uncultured archaeon]